jgi:ferric-dicitrate binding protein FerR (iron transport regulator)
LATEASIWLARLERGLQPQEGALLRTWLTDPAQGDTIVTLAKLHHGPDIVAVLADLVPVGFGSPAPPLRKGVRPAHMLIGAGVAVLALTPIILGHFAYRAYRAQHPVAHVLDRPFRPLDPVLPWGEQRYETKLGETRIVGLADGTKLKLNSQTRVDVLFGLGSRLATVKFGEVMLDTGPKRERPFEIDAGGRQFVAVSSRFDVRVTAPQAAELTVLQGSVTVLGLPFKWPTSPAEARLFDPHVFADSRVGPMQSAILQDGSMYPNPLTADNVRTRLSWEPGEVVYVNP